MLVTKRLNRRYQIGTGEVTLRIVVGEGQFGNSLVEIDDVEVASGAVAMVRLGAGGDLVGKVARVVTTVTDVQRSTNRTSMRYVLSGGPEEETFEETADVETDGGSVQYVVRFRFEA